MYVIEKESRKFDAVQFNDPSNFSNVKRGYCQTRNGHESLFISEAMPRSMDCRFCYIIETGIQRQEVKLGDWIVSNVRSESTRVYSDKKFLKKFVEFKDELSLKDSEATK